MLANSGSLQACTVVLLSVPEIDGIDAACNEKQTACEWEERDSHGKASLLITTEKHIVLSRVRIQDRLLRFEEATSCCSLRTLGSELPSISPHMVSADLSRGPYLFDGVDTESEADLRALAKEQRARVETLRENELWTWYQGNPGDTRGYLAVLGAVGSVLLVTLMTLVAPFHQGAGLLILGLLGVLCALPHWLWYRPAIQSGIAIFRRYELRPAAFFVVEPGLEKEDDDRLGAAHVVIGKAFEHPEDVRALVSAADALAADPPVENANAVEAARHDGSRQIAGAHEVAHLLINTCFLPEERLSSKHIYVFVDPSHRGPHSVRLATHWVWGEDLSLLLDAYPWRAK